MEGLLIFYGSGVFVGQGVSVARTPGKDEPGKGGKEDVAGMIVFDMFGVSDDCRVIGDDGNTV